jgi:hypothetical protein
MTTHGVVQTEPGRDRNDVFQIVKEPAFRFALLNNTSLLSIATIEPGEGAEASEGGSNVVEKWREGAFLSEGYRATRRAWEVSASLRPGVALSEDGGMTASMGEEAIKGFFNGDEYYREVVEELLERSVGITLRVPGDMTALMVAEAYFESCVEIMGSYLISELPVLV